MTDETKAALKELYWLAEELKAYTDLTGDRFDIDHAQRRLWPMSPIFKAHDLPEMEALFMELREELDVAAFFNKTRFEELVNELYGLLEEYEK